MISGVMIKWTQLLDFRQRTLVCGPLGPWVGMISSIVGVADTDREPLDDMGDKRLLPYTVAR